MLSSIEIQSGAKCHASVDERDHMESLIRSIFEAKGEINKIITYEYEPGNIGVVASEDIKKGELLIYVPHELLLTE